MPIIIIHGTALVAISQKISSIRSNFDPLSVVELSGKELKEESLLTEITTPNLFAPSKLVIVESGEDFDLSKLFVDDAITVVFKFPKQLAANSVFLKKAMTQKAQIINLSEKEETSIFPFLDLLAEKNPHALAKLDELLEKFGGQYLLTMIFYMLRRFIQAPKNLPSFVLQKMERQRKNFPTDVITNIYKEALETDFKIKTGRTDEKMGLTLLVNKILSY